MFKLCINKVKTIYRIHIGMQQKAWGLEHGDGRSINKTMT